MKGVVLAPAARQLELVRTRQISVTELAEAHIQQIERLNPKLNAFADFDAERVRAQARQLDADREQRGLLHGLPVTIKSSIATAGFRCEIGSLLHKGEIPVEDAVVVARLRAAGALILGTTNCPEFLMAYETANLLHGRTRNPWDLDRSPADRAAASLRPSLRGCPQRDSAATAEGRCEFPRTSPVSAR
jgi:Asp-tRNA(Asn)/Glu-tRNA(Gln) amidotransferase A subunit family amidase